MILLNKISLCAIYIQVNVGGVKGGVVNSWGMF